MPYANDIKTRKLLLTRIDIDKEDLSILGNNDNREIDEPPEEAKPYEPDDIPEVAPSEVPEYYNESALKSKDRNALSDDEFGIPRLRAYPLHDAAHVKQAIRMFGHCKDPKDKKTLATRIFAAMKKHGVTTKIGKENPLYEYAPKNLTESVDLPNLTVGGFEVPLEKRTRSDIVKEHLRNNGSYYNNIFYGPEFAKSLKALKEFAFLDHFYPDVKRMSFSIRLRSVCGGLASPAMQDTTYKNLGIRAPLSAEFGKPLGWCKATSGDEIADITRLLSDANYDSESNWFKVDLGSDLDHIFFCLRLYSVMGAIFMDPNFDPAVVLGEKHQALLYDWGQRVFYHYDLYLDARPDSPEQLREIQYLWDLYWQFTDSPYDENAVAVNVIAMLHNMACVSDRVISMNESNDSGEIVSKEKCSAYLTRDLGMEDDLFLLPGSMEYPIVDKNSVRLAIDMINKIPEENKLEYAKNLNRKYVEFGCNFSISVDHPYAKYANKEIVSHMERMLLEGDTAVDDEGTSTGSRDLSKEPWYKRFETDEKLSRNLMDSDELGPNTKKPQKPDYTEHHSLL